MEFTNLKLEPRRAHGLGDVLSCATYVINGEQELYNLDAIEMKLVLYLKGDYPSHQTFGSMYKALQKKWPTKGTKKMKSDRIILKYSIDNDDVFLPWNLNLCLKKMLQKSA